LLNSRKDLRRFQGALHVRFENGADVDLFDAAASIPGADAIARTELRSAARIVDPRRRIVGLGVGEAPEQFAPGDDLAQHRRLPRNAAERNESWRLCDDQTLAI
jgi:hypothetical protein